MATPMVLHELHEPLEEWLLDALQIIDKGKGDLAHGILVVILSPCQALGREPSILLHILQSNTVRRGTVEFLYDPEPKSGPDRSFSFKLGNIVAAFSNSYVFKHALFNQFGLSDETESCAGIQLDTFPERISEELKSLPRTRELAYEYTSETIQGYLLLKRSSFGGRKRIASKSKSKRRRSRSRSKRRRVLHARRLPAAEGIN